MNLNQKAIELARLIKSTDEYKRMNYYKQEIEKNKALKKNLDSYLSKKDKIYSKNKIDEAAKKISRLDIEYAKIFETPIVKKYFQSTQEFNLLMQGIYKSIEKELLK